METGQENQPELNANNPPNNPSEEEEYDNKKITSILRNIFKNTEDVKNNTSSDANIKALERVEKGIEKLGEIVQSLVPGLKEPEKKEPETPKVEIEMPEFMYVRKRGGRVVKRPAKQQQQKEASK